MECFFGQFGQLGCLGIGTCFGGLARGKIHYYFCFAWLQGKGVGPIWAIITIGKRNIGQSHWRPRALQNMAEAGVGGGGAGVILEGADPGIRYRGRRVAIGTADNLCTRIGAEVVGSNRGKSLRRTARIGENIEPTGKHIITGHKHLA